MLDIMISSQNTGSFIELIYLKVNRKFHYRVAFYNTCDIDSANSPKSYIISTKCRQQALKARPSSYMLMHWGWEDWRRFLVLNEWAAGSGNSEGKD